MRRSFSQRRWEYASRLSVMLSSPYALMPREARLSGFGTLSWRRYANRNERSRSELAITLTELNAIATAATIGLRKP